jgi:alpha-beta hydrolase superfamily lysophospholipase
LAKFAGPLLVIYGDADQAVSPEVSASAVAAAVNSSDVSELMIPGARHGLGFYTQRPEIALQVVEATADFLAEQL